MRILVVEDETRLADALEQILLENKYMVDVAHDGQDGLDYALSGIYDAMILDVMLPKKNGFEIAAEMRRQKNQTPILMLTAKDAIPDKVTGLDSGADDYLTKPFSVDELLARLRVTFRRISMLQNAAGCSVFTNGDLQIDFAAGCATLKGQELHLTPIEYRLLCVMAKNCGKVLTHTYITHEVWGSSWDNDVASLRVFMATLRKKLESEPDSPQYIQTHIGIGYRMLKV